MSCNVLTVAVSARALFDFEEAAKLFARADCTAYCEWQRQRLDEPARPGAAFSLVKKLLRFNSEAQRLVEVVILSRNDPVTGLRVFKSAAHHGLSIERGVFTSGAAPPRYLSPLGASLFLSADAWDVRAAVKAGFAAARIFPVSGRTLQNPEELRIAFDGDSVLFSDQAERIFRARKLHCFNEHEMEHAMSPLPPGPLKPFLESLCLLQSLRVASVKVRTALVTARSAPAHERAIRTLMSWGITVNEAMFLGGREKSPFLSAFEPDIFSDDQEGNCESASALVTTGHVPYGINNEEMVAL